MKPVTLLVMAAGMGSRYGGDKQTDAFGPGGETLMEYSIHDAKQAGFSKVVFVIRRSMEKTFRETVGRRVQRFMDVDYAFQEYDSLPEGFVPPRDRTKPYGTVHAVQCAECVIHEPFGVINADDYYGPGAYQAMADYLLAHGEEERACAMVAYELRNTLSPHGTVTRGICESDGQGHLVSVKETYAIARDADGRVRDRAGEGDGTLLREDAPVSMNFWGFGPWFFAEARESLREFLLTPGKDPMKCEYVLPTLVDTWMREKHLRVSMLSTPSVWFGVTYREDRDYVRGELKKLHEAGIYPPTL